MKHNNDVIQDSRPKSDKKRLQPFRQLTTQVAALLSFPSLSNSTGWGA